MTSSIGVEAAVIQEHDEDASEITQHRRGCEVVLVHERELFDDQCAGYEQLKAFDVGCGC